MMNNKPDYFGSVVQATDYIETKLDETVTLNDVAGHVGFSPYHFHRVFTALVGESVVDYARRRRLSEAARQVRDTSLPLLEIGLRYGFDSQEAFTRAFKKMFAVTPGRYRSFKDSAHYPEKKKITRELLEHIHIQGGITMEPKIVTREPELVVGMGGTFEPGDSSSISKLWDKFIERQPEIKSRNEKYHIGVCCPAHTDIPVDSGKFVYIAAAPINGLPEVPKGMVKTELPGGRYAVFTHKGPISQLGHTLNYVWGTWMPKAEYERRDAPDFELYDERFDPESLDGELDLYIPIV